MKRSIHTALRRSLALLLAALLLAPGCRPSPTLSAESGVPQYQEMALVPVPGGVVNAAGANLIVTREELSTDTLIGTHEIRARYDGKSGSWRFSFELRFDGAVFTDPTGAVHDVTALAPGAAIPGTVWSVVDGDTVETRGGLAHHFDAEGRLAWVAWRGSDHPRIEHAWHAGGLTIAACAQPAACFPFVEVAIDGGGRPVAIEGLRAGRRAEYEWDLLGRLVVARNPLEVAEGWPGTRYEYATGTTLLTASVSSEGERTEYAWQSGRRIRQVTRVGPGSPNHRFRFPARDAEGLYPVVHTNPLGAETRYRFDAGRRLREVERVDSGEVTVRRWSGRRVVEATLPGGETHSFGYLEDDLATWTRPSGNVVRFTHAPAGRNLEDPRTAAIARIEDDLGSIEERGYDALGRLASITNGEGETTSYTHHPGDAVASVTDPAGVTRTHPSYGLHGHWLTQEGALSDRRTFDPVGDPIVRSIVSEVGGVLGWVHDPGRRVGEILLGASAEGELVSEGSVVIERRSDGRVLRTLRPHGGDDEHVYDTLGRRTLQRERVDGVWQDTHFEYDAADRLIARNRPNGMREEFERDGYGRILRHRALRDGVLEGEAAYVYQQGRLVASYDSIRDATELHSYDEAGRLRTTTYGFGETVTVHYDLRSRRSGEVWTLPEHGVVADLGFEYDLANREVRVTDELSGEVLVERVFAQDRLAELRYGNGLVRVHDYDDVGRPIATTTRDASGGVVEDTSMVYEGALAPPRQRITVATSSPLASTFEDYGFELAGGLDSAGRIGKRLVSWSDGQGDERGYSWDLLSNRESDARGNAFVYNAERNRLLEASLAGDDPIAFDYDPAGYATLRDGVPITWTATGRIASHGSESFEWDLRGRLVRVASAAGEIELTLFGGRIATDPAAGSVGLLEVGEVSIALEGGPRRYRHLDFRGNVSFVSDESGDVVGHYHYAPYGVVAAYGEAAGGGGGGMTGAGQRSFVDRIEIGDLMLLGERVYDPEIGRFLSPDPVRSAVNNFAYTLGNPVLFTDPDGRSGLKTALAIGEAVVYTAGVVAVIGSGPATGAAVAVAIAIALGLGGMLVAFAIAQALSDNNNSGGGSGAIGTLGGLPAPSCSPRSLRATPNLAPWLVLLVPIQCGLAIWLLRRRREVAGGARA